MLSYRHAFHAGNHADVLKHAVLALLLVALRRKDKGFVYVDTHAGAGAYDLAGERAQRTREFEAGIARWWRSQAPVLAPWLECVRALNPDGELRRYPGSPAIAHALLRAQDRMRLLELHPADHVSLAAAFAGDARVRVERGDAHAKLRAWLPPPERRGLVLIDPPYELKQEEAQVVELLADAHRRFATGVYAIWYPVLNRLSARRFVERLAQTRIRAQLCIEYLPCADDAAAGLKGSGLVIVNPPFRFEAELATLAALLGGGDAAVCGVRWTVAE